MPREKFFRQLLGSAGVLKVYGMFNGGLIGEIRKLSGRLLIECLYSHRDNQDFLCALLDFEPLWGKVTLNAHMPPMIKQKINSNPSYLHTILNVQDSSSSAATTSDKNYWSFPEFRSTNVSSTTSQTSIEQTIPHASAGRDSLSKYLNFPDSDLYLIGFKYKKPSQAKKPIEVQPAIQIPTPPTVDKENPAT